MFKEIINKLNLKENAKILVVHQDDVGVSHGSNLAFEELCGKGFVTSGSFMVPCPWYSEIAEMCKNNYELDIGIHLTLTSEYQYYKWRPISKANKSTGANKEIAYNKNKKIYKGLSSWYGPNFHGKYTANGEIFDQNLITAAHRTLPLPSVVQVTNLENTISLVVERNSTRGNKVTPITSIVVSLLLYLVFIIFY